MCKTTRDVFGRLWPFSMDELCPTCGQPDSCGDCNHAKLSDDEVLSLGGQLPRDRFAQIGLDFIDANGQRLTSFQWCHVADGAIAAHAVIDFRGDDVERFLFTPEYDYPRTKAALLRLARRMRTHCLPARFGRQFARA